MRSLSFINGYLLVNAHANRLAQKLKPMLAGLALPLEDEIWSRCVDLLVLYTKYRLPE
jgi:hypothetical protein